MSAKWIAPYVDMLVEDPKARVSCAWNATFVVSAVLVIVAIAVAVDLGNDNKHGTRGAAFAAIWSMLLMLALCAGGTLVLRQRRTPLLVGLLLGVVAAMSQTMFVLFVLFAGLANDGRGRRGTDQAMSTFCFLLFVVLALAATVLFHDRDSIVVDESRPDPGFSEVGDAYDDAPVVSVLPPLDAPEGHHGASSSSSKPQGGHVAAPVDQSDAGLI